MLQAFYSIVDSYFVSGMKDTEAIKGVSDYAMNALTLIFAVIMMREIRRETIDRKKRNSKKELKKEVITCSFALCDNLFF